MDHKPTLPRPNPLHAPRARLSMLSARWRSQPWAAGHRSSATFAKVPFTTTNGVERVAMHSVDSQMAIGSFANVYKASDEQGNQLVVKYLKNDAAYAAQAQADRFLEIAAASNPAVRQHFIISMGWFRAVPECIANGVSFRSQGVIQQRVDGGAVMRGDTWVGGLSQSRDYTAEAAGLGAALATSVIELNRCLPAGRQMVHTDLKPANYSVVLDARGVPVLAAVFDNGALRQEGRRVDEFEATIPYNDTDTLSDPSFGLEIQAGAASTRIEQHHVHSVACNVLVAAAGVDDELCGDHAARMQVLERVQHAGLRRALRAALAQDADRRPSLAEFRSAMRDIAFPKRPATAFVVPQTPRLPWWRRMVRAVGLPG